MSATTGQLPSATPLNSEFDVTNLTSLPKVTILYSYIEPDPALIHAAIKGGAKGIIFAGTGNGTLSIFESNAVKEIQAMPAAARPALVRSSRVGNGRVTPTTEFDAMDIVASDTLNAAEGPHPADAGAD